MAEEHAGQRQAGILAAPWMKIFAAFRVAIDPQKLALAAIGILAMALGWWILAIVFFSFSPTAPTLDQFSGETEEETWKSFKSARMKWNLLYKMAGYQEIPVRVDAGDVADSMAEYKLLSAIETAVNRINTPIVVVLNADPPFLKIGAKIFTFDPASYDQRLKTLKDLKLSQLRIIDDEKKAVEVAGAKIDLVNAKDLDALKAELKAAKSLDQIEFEAQAEKDSLKRKEKLAAIEEFRAQLLNPKIKPFGYLRTWPWSEERGPNPYLLVTGEAPPDQSHGVVNWLITEQAPVLLEPLYKLFAPIKYWFDPAGGFRNRVYLFFVIVWMLVVWGVIGGAITRMAIVQVARNEKVGPAEALRFVRARIQSYVTAPLFPLVFLAGLAIFLLIFGLFEQIPLLGDILVAGLFWPVVLIFGLIMTVVLLGLVGWPLMYATLSAEGSDSFDAISRSYSYVFQATWSYLFYGVLALLYGAVLVFFVGFLSSVMVYMGKWGISNGNLWQSREPSYLFMYAPTSFGWRDLLLEKSDNVQQAKVILNNGAEVYRNQLQPEYVEKLAWYNHFGAALVSFWLTIFFMLVVGFGYSYFWTASSIIYLLMRQKVDDTEMDEIHMDDEEDEFTPPAYVPPETSKPAEPKPAQQNVTMVEAPTLRASPPASTSPPSSTLPVHSASPPPAATPAAPSPAESPSPMRAAPKTMLAPPDADPDQPDDTAPRGHNGDAE